jgi:CheY-like chemotaxis protein
MSHRVLIVDDSKLARMSVIRTLASLHADWDIKEASNADEAMQAVKDAQIDITLLDFNMPGRDGLELAGELRALQPSMPIAVVSANSQTAILARTEAAGAVFLSKPLSSADLERFLDDAATKLKSEDR